MLYKYSRDCTLVVVTAPCRQTASSSLDVGLFGSATRPVSIQTLYGHSLCRHFLGLCYALSAAASLTVTTFHRKRIRSKMVYKETEGKEEAEERRREKGKEEKKKKRRDKKTESRCIACIMKGGMNSFLAGAALIRHLYPLPLGHAQCQPNAMHIMFAM